VRMPTALSVLAVLSLMGAVNAQPRLVASGPATQTDLPATAFLGQQRCGSRSRLYLRPFAGTPSGPALLRTPVRQFSGGGPIINFAISDSGAELVSADFFVSDSGSVQQIAFSPSENSVFLVAFSPEGGLISKAKLEAEFEPYQVALFRSGVMLASGLEYLSSNQLVGHRIFNGVFDQAGRLLRKFSVPDDLELSQAALNGDQRFVGVAREGNAAVEYGDIAVAADGNAYLMRRTAPAFIYAISQRGSVVRRLVVDGGGPEFMPVSIKSASNRLAVLFQNQSSGHSRVKVITLQGNLISQFEVDDRLGEALVCYNPPNFIFVGVENNKVSFYEATPQQP
jgi:hypothetical protein